MALLPTRQRDQILLIVIVLSLGAIGGYFMYMFGDKSQEIATLETHVAALQTMNDKVKKDIGTGAFERARKEAQRFERDLRVLDQLVPRIVPARRPRQRFASEREALAECRRAYRFLPGRRIVDEEFAHAIERRRLRMPEAASDTTVAGMQMHIEQGRAALRPR